MNSGFSELNCLLYRVVANREVSVRIQFDYTACQVHTGPFCVIKSSFGFNDKLINYDIINLFPNASMIYHMFFFQHYREESLTSSCSMIYSLNKDKEKVKACVDLLCR